MKSLLEFIYESLYDENQVVYEALTHIVNEDTSDYGDAPEASERAKIKFTIWTDTNEKGAWVDDNASYKKIEYNYESEDKKINIQFLLGYKDNSWQLWMGKNGAVSYDDDSYKNLETEKFADAILSALNEIQKATQMVKDDPSDWVQYYV